ncbi:ATP-grasp domain-containing protein [Chloroflexota bacterium]
MRSLLLIPLRDKYSNKASSSLLFSTLYMSLDPLPILGFIQKGGGISPIRGKGTIFSSSDIDFNLSLQVSIVEKGDIITLQGISGVFLVGITERNGQLISLVGNISRKLRFLGPVNFQFKEDKESIPKLIEINPRCSGGMVITLKSGVNLPKLALSILKEKEILEDELQWEERTVFRYLTEVEM